MNSILHSNTRLSYKLVVKITYKFYSMYMYRPQPEVTNHNLHAFSATKNRFSVHVDYGSTHLRYIILILYRAMY